MDGKDKKTLLITGFGPFGKHVVNSSWEAVKEFKKLSANLEQRPEIICEEIPVSYQHVSSVVPEMWEKLKPTYVIHVGVSHLAQSLMIESRAHRTGYCRKDIDSKLPEEKDTEQNILETLLDVKKIREAVNDNSAESKCKAKVSHDAGRYLCEYIFYQSLGIDPSRVLFIHVPDFNVYSSDQCARGLYDVVRYLLESQEENE